MPYDKWAIAAGKLYMQMKYCDNDVVGISCAPGDVMEWTLDESANDAAVTQRLIIGQGTFPGCCSGDYWDRRFGGVSLDPINRALLVFGDSSTSWYPAAIYPSGDAGWLYKGVSA